MGPDALIFVTCVLLATLALIGGFLYLHTRALREGYEPHPLPLDWADADGWRIRYHRSGYGPPLVLLHGIGANLYCWRTLIPKLTTRFTVIALDLPGFGQSSMPDDAQYGLDEQVQRLRAFLTGLGINQSYLVGNSMGGNLALWYALEHPAEVRGLAVIAPATSPGLIPVQAKRLLWAAKPAALLNNRLLMTWAHRRTVSKPHLVDRVRVEETFKTYGRNHAAIRTFLLATESIRDSRLGARLKELKTPLLILWGARDRLVPRRVIDALESAVAGHESYRHETGGHHLQEDEPEWVAEKIDTFFKTSPT